MPKMDSPEDVRVALGPPPEQERLPGPLRQYWDQKQGKYFVSITKSFLAFTSCIR